MHDATASLMLRVAAAAAAVKHSDEKYAPANKKQF
jgi:hypothetical protein